MTVEEIQDYVIREIMKAGYFDVANAYIKYRYNRDLARKKDSTDDEILTLIDGFNKEMAEENSNKDTTLASTQRDYIAGIVSRSLTQRVLLPEAIAKAHNDGLLHFHDADYFIQHIFNCCLIDLGDMLDNGTVMNGKKIDPPNGFQVACTVLTQISAAVASNQLGGQSIDVSHLGKYLRKSHEKFLRKTRAACGDEAPQELVEKIANDRLIDDLQSGIQTIQYQINTLMTTNGQAPFITLFLCLRDDDPYIEENAMIIEEILKQRLQGIKNEAGVYTTPAFPKLVYVLDENNCLKGGKYDYLTELAVRCSIKRMYPDYISAKKMRENYEGQVFSPMGCVDGRETVKYHYEGNVYTESIEAMWNRLLDKYEVKTQPNGSDLYMDTDGVLIYDHKTGYVKNYRIIRNYSDSWVKVKLTSGHSLLCTTDHPFETENRGVVYAKDLTTDDQISILSNGIKNDKYASYWAYKIDVANVKSVTPIVKEDYSYDVTSESEHFTVSNIYSHNCRSFLTTYKDKDGKYKFEGRFNQGVVTINLPQVALSVTNGGEFVPATEHEFWIELDKRLELCREALMCRHKRLLGTRSDISPLHWQHGAIARLKPGEVIDPLLKNNYSTISLGYIGIYEMTKLMKGQSHTAPEGKEFAMRVMRHLKDTATRWRAESGHGFSL